MKIFSVTLLLSACSCLLPAQSRMLNFRESNWSESKTCIHCATCNGQAVDGTETQMNDLGIVWTPGQKNGQAVRSYSVYSQYFCFN